MKKFFGFEKDRPKQMFVLTIRTIISEDGQALTDLKAEGKPGAPTSEQVVRALESIVAAIKQRSPKENSPVSPTDAKETLQ